jgi:L-histidine N-alpha-methyltransferase
VSPIAAVEELAGALDGVASAVRAGLTAIPKTLPPWLFYDAAGSVLFEQITDLPEYYLTRTERTLLSMYANEMLRRIDAPVTIVELGAGTATKTGILLRAAAARQSHVLYQPIDVSASALEEARANIEAKIPGVEVRPGIANYVNDPVRIERVPGHSVLAMYIGSSIGNFSPSEAREILGHLRSQMVAGDHLILGTDLAPGRHKSVAALLDAYDDAEGVTAEFNRNVLVRLNRELGADFAIDRFRHRAHWNATESRMEMHLESLVDQRVTVPENEAGYEMTLHLRAGETIHTENSYKFTLASIADLLRNSGFEIVTIYQDEDERFALTLAGVA